MVVPAPGVMLGVADAGVRKLMPRGTFPVAMATTVLNTFPSADGRLAQATSLRKLR
jgi:hypothetical protein